MATKTYYRIENAASGHDFGAYLASSKAQALDMLAQDAGYRDRAHACEATGDDGSDLLVTEYDPEEVAL